MRTTSACALLSILGCFAACERRETAEPVMTPASRTTPSAERAAEDAARAQCDRAERCAQVGENALYSSRQHCLNVLWEGAAQHFGACRSGVDHAELDRCLTEITERGCGESMAGFQQYVTCGVEDVCVE